MPGISASVVLRFAAGALVVLWSSTPAFSQGRGGVDWSAAGNDAQRSSWVRTDPRISVAQLQGPGFQLIWKLKLQNSPLSQPVLMDRYIGYRGFRSYAFIGNTSNEVFTLDSDLARLEWQKKLPIPSPAAGSATCPGGMTAGVTRRIGAAFPAANVGRGFGGGRGGPAKSGVGTPGEGAVTLAAAPAAPRGPAPAAPPPGGAGRGRTPSFLTVLASDGALHDMYVSNGEEPSPPLRFLAPNANVSDLTFVDDIAYAVTTGNCGGVQDGLWALDPESKQVKNWQGNAIGTAFAPDNTVYVTTAAGDLVALEGKSLTKKASYSSGQPFISSPVVFEANGKTLVAAATKDGAIHVVDGASLSKIASSPGRTPTGAALAAWHDAAGTTWILHGDTAWKLSGGSIQTGWTASNLSAPATAAVVNGVVFLAAAGSPSVHAILYALDGATGKQLWSSGNTINSYIAPKGGLAAGGSTIYLGTHDGTLWAFGFPIEH